jgi:hypothetical protein
MITNKEDFQKHRKTRVELLEERIINAQKLIDEINNELKKEDEPEISRLEKILNEVREMKNSIIQQDQVNRNEINSELEKINKDSLLILNNEKMRIVFQNEKLEKEKKDNQNYIKKLEEELMHRKLEIELYKKKENDLLEQASILDDKLKILRSKAYGYDIAKKFEVHQNKINSEKSNIIDPNRNKTIEDEVLAFNFWERENLHPIKNSKLEDLTKQKGMWIGNPGANIEKFIYDTDSNAIKNNHIVNNPYGNKIQSNMRKFSPMILNNK